ncbi:hypothetical protein [Frigidibacter sp. MR17.24]
MDRLRDCDTDALEDIETACLVLLIILGGVALYLGKLLLTAPITLP